MAGVRTRRSQRPTDLKLISGTDPRKVNTAAPVPRRAEPEPPAWFTVDQRRIWDQTVIELRALDLLARADQQTLISYCTTSAMIERIVRQLNGHRSLTVVGGHGSEHAHPLLATLDRLTGRATIIANLFGLTPAGRASLRGDKARPDTESAHDHPARTFGA